MSFTKVSSRVATTACGAVLVLGLAAAPALAYPPGVGLTISASNGVITVSNVEPGCVVDLIDNGKLLGQELSNADGTVTFKGNTSPGRTLVASVNSNGDVGGCEADTATLVIPGGVTPTPTPTPTASPSPTPSRTGSNTALGIVAGIGALGVGGGLVVASRRKNA
jgi:LPXTG-motif cell wall-anchored protein